MSSDITPKKITVQYHRNGICGRGFTAITFTQTDPDESEYNGRLTAIIPGDDEYELHDVECYVIHTSKPDLSYRGDYYNGTMREIIKAHDIRHKQQIKDAGKRDPNEPYVDPGITHFKDMNEVRETLNGKPAESHASKRFANII